MSREPVVELQDLVVTFDGPPGVRAVDGVSLAVHRGECVALVGESGSGKSVTARTLVGLTGTGARVQHAGLRLLGEDASAFSPARWRRVRGARVGFVLQDALSSLDPLRTIGREVGEPLVLHEGLSRRQVAARSLELLASVGVPEPEVRAAQHPAQLSGGLRQRALIASAIACDPELLIADEPTTALDTTVQAQVLDLLGSLKSASTAMLVVSHDLAVVARLADRVLVMQGGRVVEQGTTAAVLTDPQHPYTRSLLAAVPGEHSRGTRLSGPRAGDAQVPAPRAPRATGVPLLRAHGLTKAFAGPDGRPRTVVGGVDLEVHAGRTLGVVGESGSGKTTTARMLLGVEQQDSGTVEVEGRDRDDLSGAELRSARRRVQVVYQDPLSSFDPRYTVERVVSEAVAVAGVRGRAERRRRVLELLELVRLDPGVLDRRPLELSGGQRQRVAIARALAAEPEVIVCDEPVSALDVSVQAQVLDLLDDLQRRLGVAYLFISHDLGVVAHVSDDVVVMKDGRVVESGPVLDVFGSPQHPYTRELLDAVPRLQPASSTTSSTPREDLR